MLKKRIIAVLTVLDGVVVQSIGFKKYLPIGKPAIAVEFLNQWGIDEILISDISARKQNREPDFEIYRKLSSKCYVPLTIGGGITSIDQIRRLLNSGADKVAVNSYAIERPSFISEAAHVFGDQCIVVAIDAIRNDEGKYVVYDHIQRRSTGRDLLSWAGQAAKLGAGELFINCVHRDGSYKGFDNELNQQVAQSVGIPVIVCGGAGKPEHFYETLNQTSVAAVAAGNYFHFNEHSVNVTKAYLESRGLTIRLETFANYVAATINERNRLEKSNDAYLEHLLYQPVHKEII